MGSLTRDRVIMILYDRAVAVATKSQKVDRKYK